MSLSVGNWSAISKLALESESGPAFWPERRAGRPSTSLSRDSLRGAPRRSGTLWARLWMMELVWINSHEAARAARAEDTRAPNRRSLPGCQVGSPYATRPRAHPQAWPHAPHTHSAPPTGPLYMQGTAVGWPACSRAGLLTRWPAGLLAAGGGGAEGRPTSQRTPARAPSRASATGCPRGPETEGRPGACEVLCLAAARRLRWGWAPLERPAAGERWPRGRASEKKGLPVAIGCPASSRTAGRAPIDWRPSGARWEAERRGAN